MQTNSTILEALKQSNYFLKQYAGMLSQNDRFIVLKQYAENIKVMREIAPELSQEERAGFMLLHGAEQQQSNNEPFNAMLLRYGIVNEYQIRNNSKEIKSLKKSAQGLNSEQIENVLRRAQAFKEGANNFYAYLNKCFQNEKKESRGND